MSGLKVMVLSYNEGQKYFDEDDCKEVIEKINNTKPDIIVLCSQEAVFKGNGFGHFLSKLLENKYIYFKHERETLSTFNKTIKTVSILGKSISEKLEYRDVRTKIFVKKNLENKLNEKNTKNFFGRKIKEKYIPSVSINFTVGKGSIFSKLEIDNNNKFIFINSHYAFKGSGNTALPKRIDQFVKTIYQFNLQQYVNTHQIFFSGDLNFRLSKDFFEKYQYKINKYNGLYKINNNHSPDKTNTINLDNENIFIEKGKVNSKVNSKVNTDIFKKLHYYINKLNNNAITHNELYKFLSDDKLLETFQKWLKEEEISRNIEKLLNNFRESIEDVGIYVTCRYSEGKEKSNSYKKVSNPQINENRLVANFSDRGLAKLDRIIEKTDQNTKTYNEKIKICGNIVSCEKHGTPRVPSMCDKILYSFPENISRKVDFFTFNIPYKSDHKMIGLVCDFSSETMSYKKNDPIVLNPI